MYIEPFGKRGPRTMWSWLDLPPPLPATTPSLSLFKILKVQTGYNVNFAFGPRIISKTWSQRSHNVL